MTPGEAKKLKELEAEEADRRFIEECHKSEVAALPPAHWKRICERVGVTIERALDLGFWQV